MLTLEQAAAALATSTEHIKKLIENNSLETISAVPEMRIATASIIALKKSRDARRSQALNELAHIDALLF